MSNEQKMREALEQILSIANQYAGDYPTQVVAIAQEALAAPAGGRVDLTDEEIYETVGFEPVSAKTLLMIKACIDAHEAKRGGAA